MTEGNKRWISAKELLEQFPIQEGELSCQDGARFVWEWLQHLHDEERVEFLATLAEHFCKHCGTTHLPCSCWNDE